MGNGNENNNEDKNIKEFENMVDERKSIEEARSRAEKHVLESYDLISKQNASSCAVPFEEVLDIAQHSLDFHNAIWEASTSILPNLEVQVVIDAKNKCFVTTGSAGYVGEEWEKGLNLPIGLSLPIRCWIHTHPFGAAYFSQTDISTVTTFNLIMESAYVLGGEGHFGFWTQTEPNALTIYVENEINSTQIWGSEEE